MSANVNPDPGRSSSLVLPGALDTAWDERDIDHSGSSGGLGVAGWAVGVVGKVCVCVLVCFDTTPIETGEPN